VSPASGTILVNVTGTGSTGVGQGPSAGRVLLGNPAPNPFIPAAGALAVEFSVPAEMSIDLAVFDLMGRRIASLAHGVTPAGERSARWDGRDASGQLAPVGAYLLRLEAGDVRRALRFVIAR